MLSIMFGATNHWLSMVILLTGFLTVCPSGYAATGTANDTLVLSARYDSGEVVPYMLTTAPTESAGAASETSRQRTRYTLILMPGGAGLLNPEMQDGRLVFEFGGDFLIRSRALFADASTDVVSTNASPSAQRMRAIVKDLHSRNPNAHIYIIGTSRSTSDTIGLAQVMDGEVAGFVHTSSMREIGGFDTRGLKSRQLIVHHQDDGCRVTPYGAAQTNHERYGTEFISVTGGISRGDPCEGRGHHGYNGIEAEVVAKIKAWIRRDGEQP